HTKFSRDWSSDVCSSDLGPAPRPDSPLAAVAAEVVDATSMAWDAVQPSIALEHTWRLIHETNSLLEDAEPWKMDPGPEVDAVLGARKGGGQGRTARCGAG